MMAAAQKSPDYTAYGVGNAFWLIGNISGTSSGNDTNRERDPTLVFEMPIFS